MPATYPSARSFGDAAAGLADHEHDLALVFELLGFGRPQDRLIVRDEAIRRLEEHAGILRLGVAAGRRQFGVTVGVVHPDAENFFAAHDRRQQFRLAKREIRPHPGRNLFDLVESARTQHIENRRQPGSKPRTQIHDTLAGHDAEARAAADVVGGKMHDGLPGTDRADRCRRGTIGRQKPP